MVWFRITWGYNPLWLKFLLMRPCSENSTITKSFVIPVFLLFYFVMNKDKKRREKKKHCEKMKIQRGHFATRTKCFFNSCKQTCTFRNILKHQLIGHFRITFGLFFKASPGAHLFIWKLVFICMWMKTNFHMKGWAPGLALKKRPRVKWPIIHIGFRLIIQTDKL